MRIRSAIWVGAYVRRCFGEGNPAMVVRRGAEEAGAIFVKLNLLDGTAIVFAPAPQTAFDDEPSERMWIPATGQDPISEADADAYLSRQRTFDPDLWIVEVEARDGRHLLTVVDGA